MTETDTQTRQPCPTTIGSATAYSPPHATPPTPQKTQNQKSTRSIMLVKLLLAAQVIAQSI